MANGSNRTDQEFDPFGRPLGAEPGVEPDDPVLRISADEFQERRAQVQEQLGEPLLRDRGLLDVEDPEPTDVGRLIELEQIAGATTGQVEAPVATEAPEENTRLAAQEGQRFDPFGRPIEGSASQAPTEFDAFGRPTGQVSEEEIDTGRDAAEGLINDLLDGLQGLLQTALPTTITGVTPQQKQEQLVQTAERAAEVPLILARGAVFLPAGAERVLVEPALRPFGVEEIPDAIEIDDVRIPISPQGHVSQINTAQQFVQDFFGNDPSPMLDLVGELVGGYVTADQLFKIPGFVHRFAMNRTSPALFRPLTAEMGRAKAVSQLTSAEQRVWANWVGGSLDEAATIAGQADRAGQLAARLARVGTAGAEGSLFIAGMPESDARDIAWGGVGGVILQGGAELVGQTLARKAMQAFPDREQAIQAAARAGGELEIEGFPSFLARVTNNAKLAKLTGRSTDEQIAALRATLSERGETGVLGAVRGLTDLDTNQLQNLRRAFPEYRFETIVRVRGDEVQDVKLVYGLKPGQRLPEGTRSAPSLTDDILKEYRETGFLRGERVLVDGVEHRFLSTRVKGDRIKVKPMDGGTPVDVPRDQVMRLGSDAVETLENPRLFNQFQRWKAANKMDNWEEATTRFMDEMVPDLPERLRPHLRQYFAEQDIRRAARRLRPDETAALRELKRIRRRQIETGEVGSSLEEQAAAKMHMTHRFTDGRVKFTNAVDGETTRIFRDEARGREYIQDVDARVPDVTPSIPGVPDELVQGAAVAHPKPNPSIPATAEIESRTLTEMLKNSPQAITKLWTQHLAPQWLQLEDVARLIETADAPIWRDGIQRLSMDARVAMNRARPFQNRLVQLWRGADEADQDLIKRWLRSESKDQFARKHSMSEELVQKAEQARIWFDDFFDEVSAATGIDMDGGAYIRNYAPDWLDYTARTGNNNFDEMWQAAHPNQEMPASLRFFAEEWKSGAAAEYAQQSLFAQMSRMNRAGMLKAHAGEAYEEALALLKELEPGSEQRIVLNEYLHGIKGGHTGVWQQKLDDATTEVWRRMGWIEEGERVRNPIDRGIDISYGGTIGWRPALVWRNRTQPFNLGGPIVGFNNVRKARADAYDEAFQRELIRRGIIEDEQLPIQFRRQIQEGRSFFATGSRKSLSYYGRADTRNRAQMALATKRSLEPELRKFQAGEINHTELLENSGLWVLDSSQRQVFFDLLDGKRANLVIGEDPFDRAMTFAMDEIGSKLTNFLYGARNTRQWLRDTPGRVFGAYGTWNRGYLNWLTQIASADVRTGVKVKALAQHAAFNLAVKNAGKVVGLQLGSWMAYNSITFGGSPMWDFLGDVGTVFAGPPWEREAAAKRVFTQAPLELFLPGGFLIFNDIPTAVERLGQGRPGAAIGEALGFSTTDQPEPQTMPQLP